MTKTTTKDAGWKLPDLDTVYECWDGARRTLQQMLDGVDDDLVPADEVMFNDLLWAWGA